MFLDSHGQPWTCIAYSYSIKVVIALQLWLLDIYLHIMTLHYDQRYIMTNNMFGLVNFFLQEHIWDSRLGHYKWRDRIMYIHIYTEWINLISILLVYHSTSHHITHIIRGPGISYRMYKHSTLNLHKTHHKG